VATPADQLGKNDAPPQRHVVLKPDLQVQPQPGTRGGQTGTRQVYKQGGATDASQQQDPKTRRNFDSQGQPQGQDANRNKAQGDSNRNKAQGASNNQPREAPRNQSGGGSKKKDKD
jgi:hypothetical protein